MSPTIKSLGIDRLGPKERVALALEIWESLDGDRPSGQMTAARRKELSRRDQELDEKPELARTWEEIRRNVEKKK